MGIEGARQHEENPEERIDESIEAPMSREILALKNGIQTEIIKRTISQEDVEEYPQKWIDDNSNKFHAIFVKEIKSHPELVDEWQDESKHPEIADRFKEILDKAA